MYESTSTTTNTKLSDLISSYMSVGMVTHHNVSWFDHYDLARMAYFHMLHKVPKGDEIDVWDSLYDQPDGRLLFITVDSQRRTLEKLNCPSSEDQRISKLVRSMDELMTMANDGEINISESL